MTYKTDNGVRWTEKPRGLWLKGQLEFAPPPRSLEEVNALRMGKIAGRAHMPTEHNPLGIYIPAAELAQATPSKISVRVWFVILSICGACGFGLAMLLPST